MRKRKQTGVRLPEGLQEQVNDKASDDHHHFRALGRKKASRKELRKQERSTRKQNKAQYFSHSKNSAQIVEPVVVQSTKRLADEHTDSPARKRARNGPGPVILTDKENDAKKVANGVESSQKQSKPSKKPATQWSLSKPLKKSATAAPRMPKSQVEEKEDAYIRMLEQQLGYSNTRGKKKNPDEEDGLDDLLDFADNLTYSLTKSGQGFSEEDTNTNESSGVMDSCSEGSDLDDGFSLTSGDNEDEFDSEEQEENDDEEKEWGGIESSSEAEEDEIDPAETPTAGAAYVPPHLRKSQEKPSETLLKLTRQLKGLLNRMSEQNLSNILDGMEDIYRDNSRNDVTSTLTNLIIEGVSSHSILLDSYVVLHAAFVSSLHKLVGVEFAAHFLQQIVSMYETHYAAFSNSSPDSLEDESDRGKECSNLIVLLSELYNFQVISSVLMFDIVRSLLQGEVTEFNVELLLKILRNSGQQLRTDDPLALKDIVQLVQDKVTGNEDSMSSRTRFMIETLTNLKNNKIKKLGEQNQGGAAVDRMKRFLSGLSKSRHVLTHEPLRVSLEDLHSASTKGKWWLVGAAWGGDPLVDRQANIEVIAASQKAAREEESNLLKLARKQGMNSDIRRSIFVVLMSSEDYIDACDRLSQLNLTEVQQREIVRVLLHCCGNEKSYNPYYALVCEHLCRQSHSYKITVQFCLWDFLRDLGETEVGGAEIVKKARENDGFDVKDSSRSRIKNVARSYAWWISKDAVQFGILKPVDFTMLKAQTKDFLKELLVQVFINSQLATPLITDDLENVTLMKNRGSVEEIFIKASRIDTVAMGLVYFMSEAFRSVQMKEDNLSKFVVWAAKIAKETLQTGLDVIPGLEP